jgi:hypothetical protein
LGVGLLTLPLRGEKRFKDNGIALKRDCFSGITFQEDLIPLPVRSRERSILLATQWISALDTSSGNERRPDTKRSRFKDRVLAIGTNKYSIRNDDIKNDQE